MIDDNFRKIAVENHLEGVTKLVEGASWEKARRQASGIEEGSMDDFLNRMGLGDPDPSNHKTGFTSADDVIEWFQQDKPDDWRQRD